jgi:hypothetical protein
MDEESRMMIATVLRSGGRYNFEDVNLLYHQVKKMGILNDSPEPYFTCFTDIREASEVHPDIQLLPLLQGWPGWWSKMELFRPGLDRSILYFDLDTMFVRPFPTMMRRLFQDNRPAILRDFYADRVQSAMMFIPQDMSSVVWDHFMLQPAYWMRKYEVGGDQEFLNPFFYNEARRLQDMFPGKIVSFKATLGGVNRVPEPASIVIFHGDPKPRDIQWNLITV